MDPRTVTGRVVHGGYRFFKEAAPRIDAVVPEGDRLILTRGALHLPLPAVPYWFYNTEPLHVRGKRTPQYMNLLNDAERVFEYSQPNLRWYLRGQFCPIQLGEVGTPPDLARCDVDVLFYGHVTPRRQVVLNALSADTIMAFGGVRDNWVRRAKIVLCLNAYDDVNGNPFRVFPVLEAGGGHVVSEWCQEEWFNKAVEPHGLIVSYGDLVDACRQLLKELKANGA